MFPAVATTTFIMLKTVVRLNWNLTRPMATALRVSEARNIGQAFAWAAPPPCSYATVQWISYPLRNLTKQKYNSNGPKSIKRHFEKIKEMLYSDSTMAYFDPTKDTELTTASPDGLSAILSQKTPGTNNPLKKTWLEAYRSSYLHFIDHWAAVAL